jgi:hypothetical protein
MVESHQFCHLNVTSIRPESKSDLIFIDEPLKTKAITLYTKSEKTFYQAKYLKNTGLLTVQESNLSV